MTKIVGQVAEKRRSIWEKEPPEVRRALTKSAGTFDESFFPALYATEGSRNIHFTLVAFRKVLLDPKSDLETVKTVVKTYLPHMVPVTFSLFGMTEAGGFLESIAAQIDTVTTREELLALVEELAFYVGRLNYWLDAAMPWYQLVETYEKLEGRI